MVLKGQPFLKASPDHPLLQLLLENTKTFQGWMGNIIPYHATPALKQTDTGTVRTAQVSIFFLMCPIYNNELSHTTR